MEDNKLSRFFGALLTGLGILVLLVVVIGYLKENRSVLGLDVSGGRIFVPAILGLVFFLAGVSMINRN